MHCSYSYVIQRKYVWSCQGVSSFIKSLVFTVASLSVYSAPPGVWNIVINPSVCVCVCLSASIFLEPLDRSSRNLVRRSPVAVARSFSGGVAIRYVLPVLWITSRFAVVGRMALAALRHRGGVWCLWRPCSLCMSTTRPRKAPAGRAP